MTAIEKAACAFSLRADLSAPRCSRGTSSRHLTCAVRSPFRRHFFCCRLIVFSLEATLSSGAAKLLALAAPMLCDFPAWRQSSHSQACSSRVCGNLHLKLCPAVPSGTGHPLLLSAPPFLSLSQVTGCPPHHVFNYCL